MEDRTGSEITRALDSLWKPDASRQERIMRGFREATELRESRTGLGLATLGSLLLGAVVIITLVIGRWATSGHPILPLTVPATAAHARLFAMLADNTVVAFDNGATTPAWTARLAPPPQAGQNGYIPTGHYIALSADETLVYALPLSESRGARELDVLDAGTGRVLRRHSFAGTGILYGTLSVGPQSGWLYIV